MTGASTSAVQQGAASSVEPRWMSVLLVLAVGVAIWMFPVPAGVDPRGWHLLAIFVATVVGIITKPLPMGAVALIGLGVVSATNTLPIDKALLGFANPQIWLIALACFIARGFIKTGLAARVSFLFLAYFGRTAIGLSYGFILSDLFMAPAIPSSTARAGGVLAPILRSLSGALGSKPNEASSERIGSFLVLSLFMGTIVTSTMFITAMAPNPIIARLALGTGIEITWTMWAKAALVPGLVSLAIIPFVVRWFAPPSIEDVSEAAAHANEKLAELGQVKKNEWMMLLCFILLLVMWIFGPQLGLDPTVAAILGVGFLMLSSVLSWKDILSEEVAWDSLVWFAVLVTMAGNLNTLGVIPWFSGNVVKLVDGVSWPYALMVLGLVYFYSHYFFASITAHVTSMFIPFLAVCVDVGAPPLLATLVLAYLSGLSGCLTHYGTGQGPVLFGLGYVPLKAWWGAGFALSVIFILLWGTLGFLWWSWIGII